MENEPFALRLTFRMFSRALDTSGPNQRIVGTHAVRRKLQLIRRAGTIENTNPYTHRVSEAAYHCVCTQALSTCDPDERGGRQPPSDLLESHVHVPVHIIGDISYGQTVVRYHHSNIPGLCALLPSCHVTSKTR